MTLLEAVAALVIVGLSAVGWIGLAQGSSRTTRDAAQWQAVVATAEAAMERTLIAVESGGVDGEAGQRPSEPPTDATLPDALRTTVDIRPWGPGISELRVVVRMPDGSLFTLHRLVRDDGP